MGLYYYSSLAKLVPAYFPRLLAEELKDKHARGYRHITVESGQGWPWHGPMAYVEKRLLWDIGLDVDELLDDYFTELYGPAAPYMGEMYGLFEEIHMRPRRGGFLYEHYNYAQFRPYTGQDLERIRELIAGAHDAMEALPVPRGSREAAISGRLGYVTNGLKVFLDMLEGKALAGELDAMGDKIDDVTAVTALKNIRRANTLMERHERLYRETVISDENMPGRFTRDTARVVRNSWKSRLSSAAGEALVKLDAAAGRRFRGLDRRVVEMLVEEVARYTSDELLAGLFLYRTGRLTAGDNLTVNPGFEESGEDFGDFSHLDWEASPALGWFYWQHIPGMGAFDFTDEVSRSGGRAGRMDGIGSGGFCTVVREVEEGALYHVRAYVKNTAHVTRAAKPYVRFVVFWLDEDDRWHSRPRGGAETAELDRWVELEYVVRAPEGAASAAIWVFGNNLQDGEEIFVDDVTFRRLYGE